MMAPLYLDCDTGVDDALALAFLLRSRAQIAGIGTVSGTVSSAAAARNTLHLLELAERTEIPVAVGRNSPLAGPFAGGAAHVHGNGGLGSVAVPTPRVKPVASSATDLLIELSHLHARRLAILAIGPLTNLADALEKDPSLPERIAHVTVMGGAVNAPGNVTPVAEANIWNDPEAASVVFNASWEITLVPLDVTMQHLITAVEVQELAASPDRLLATVARALETYLDFYTSVFMSRSAALHDPLAAAIAVDALSVTSTIEGILTVDTSAGPERGRTTCRPLETSADGQARQSVVLATEPALPVIMAAFRRPGGAVRL